MPEVRHCPFGEPSCPCQDGDVCHYVAYRGTVALPPPPARPEVLEHLARSIHQTTIGQGPEYDYLRAGAAFLRQYADVLRTRLAPPARIYDSLDDQA